MWFTKPLLRMSSLPQKLLILIFVVVLCHFMLTFQHYVSSGDKNDQEGVLDHGLQLDTSDGVAIYHETRNINFDLLVQDELPGPYLQRDISPEYANLLDLPTPEFLPGYRNPCWSESITPSDGKFEGHEFWRGQIEQAVSGATEYLQEYYTSRLKGGTAWKLRCLPYFYIAGVTKCGTSDLYAMINNHPLIASPVKEINWWSIIRTTRKQEGYVPIKHYIDILDIAAVQIENYTEPSEDVFGSDDFHPMIVGDGSPNTFWRNTFWKFIPEANGTDGPSTHNAQYIRHVTPDVKIILIFRDPVARAYSQYNYAGGHSAVHFHHVVKTSLKAMADCLQKYGEWYCVNINMPPVFLRLAVGMYVVFLEKWLEVFPKEQLYIVRLEDYASNRASTANEIFRFLDIGELPINEIEAWNEDNIRNKRRRPVEPILNETRELLEDFYHPYNERLAKLLRDERYQWNKYH